MNRKRSIFLLTLFVMTLWYCTPKVTEATTATEPKANVLPASSDDPCAKFSDSKAGEAALDAHVIYRDYLRAERFDEAMPYWRQAFNAAPAADGKRKSHYTDGVKLYKNLMDRATDEAGKNIYMDSIKYMQKRMGDCFSEEPGYSEGLIAFDQYYQYREMVSNEEIFRNFKAAYNKMGMDAHAFVINPFTALLVEMYQNKEIEKDTALKYAQLVLDITKKNEHNKKDGWPIVLTYAPARLEIFEVEKGFYGCEYFSAKYYPEFLEDSKNCDVIETVLIRLKWGDCDEMGEELQALRKAYNEHCRKAVPTSGPLTLAKGALENGEYQEATELYQKYVDSQTDPEKRAKFLLRISKIYYAHIKNFPKAREYARLAIKERPDWGEPYILIGKLYASSGPLCGPGRGWDSQIVTWPAVDMFRKAKSIDSSVSKEANKWINTYEQYMPSTEDIFQRNMQVGQSFRVGCWIQETTTIRAAK